MRYELTATDQFGVDVDFIRTGSITIGAAPSTIPALVLPGVIVLVFGISILGMYRLRG